jgi:RHS repeat-associated protein
LCRFSQGTLGTDKKFTGQRLDGTGLYYYNARYYDATIGRFISADTVGIDYNNPQTLNRYSYCLNNPLNRTDPTGHFSWKTALKIAAIVAVVAVVAFVAIVAAPIVLTAIAGTASLVAALPGAAAIATVAEGVASVALTGAEVSAAIAAPVIAFAPVPAAVVTTMTSVFLGYNVGEQPYVVQDGEFVNRVYDSRATETLSEYSPLKGGSYCPGGAQGPLSASLETINRGLTNPPNNAQCGAVFQATQNIPAILRTSIGGTSPEIVINSYFWDYLKVFNTFKNNP